MKKKKVFFCTCVFERIHVPLENSKQFLHLLHVLSHKHQKTMTSLIFGRTKLEVKRDFTQNEKKKKSCFLYRRKNFRTGNTVGFPKSNFLVAAGKCFLWDLKTFVRKRNSFVLRKVQKSFFFVREKRKKNSLLDRNQLSRF